MLFYIERGTTYYLGHVVGVESHTLWLYHADYGVEPLYFTRPGTRHYLTCPD